MRTGLASTTGQSFDGWNQVGELIGLGAVKRSVDDAFDDAEKQLRLLETSIDNLPIRDYRSWANWCTAVDEKVPSIELLILEGRRFFSKANLHSCVSCLWIVWLGRGCCH